MAEIGSLLQGLTSGFQVGHSMALQAVQAKQKRDQLAAQEKQQDVDNAFKAFGIGLKLSNKDNPLSLRVQGTQLMKQSWQTVFPDADMSSLDDINYDDKAFNTAIGKLDKYIQKISKGEVKRESLPTFVLGVVEEYDLNKEQAEDLATAGKESSAAIKDIRVREEKKAAAEKLATAKVDAARLKTIQANLKLEAKGPKGSVALKKAAILEANPELDDKTATGLATGTIRLSQSPVTNEVSIVDLIAGTVRPLGSDESTARPIVPDKPIPGGPTIFDLHELITGPGSAAKQAASVVSGMVGGPIFKATARARQFTLTAQNDLIRALSINPRFPVGEIKRIKEEMSIEPRFFDNPKLLRERIRSIDRFLRIRLGREQKASRNTTLSAKSRQGARDAITNIESFLQILGNPPSFNDPDDPAFLALPSGSKFYFGDQVMTKN